MDYVQMSAVFRSLALAAGDAIMEIYGRDDFSERLKSDSSPVTAADEAADVIISAGLRRAFPQIPLVTEEQAASHTVQGRTFLIVDPLDGTKEFIQRRGDFTVNIAYVKDGVPVRGIVYAPAKNRLFWTDHRGDSFEEMGAFSQEKIGGVKALQVRKPNNSALVVVASKSHRDKATDDYISKYQVGEFSSAGSSMKFCLVASGEADFYPRLGRTMEWDTAAGHAVLSGAGGAVFGFDDRKTLTYGKQGFANPFFLAFAPGVDLKD